MMTAERRRNYLRQNGDRPLTGKQQRRIKHKMGQHRHAAIRRRRRERAHGA